LDQKSSETPCCFGLAQIVGEDRRRQDQRDGLVKLDHRIEVAAFDHIEDRRKGLAALSERLSVWADGLSDISSSFRGIALISEALL
jgi:hypothetical protein